MKNNFIPAVKLTFFCLLLFAVAYPLALLGIAQLAPNSGKGIIVEYAGHTYYRNIAQSFTQDQFFWSRPSAVDYNAAGSGGSNKAATNKEYLAVVQGRIDDFLKRNPGLSRSEIPVDLVTASSSGLDPHISIKAARVQVKRIAQARNLSEDSLQVLVDHHIEKPLLGLFGPEYINVLELNIALNRIDHDKKNN